MMSTETKGGKGVLGADVVSGCFSDILYVRSSLPRESYKVFVIGWDGCGFMRKAIDLVDRGNGSRVLVRSVPTPAPAAKRAFWEELRGIVSEKFLAVQETSPVVLYHSSNSNYYYVGGYTHLRNAIEGLSSPENKKLYQMIAKHVQGA
jgi:hypothetical protein